MLFKKHLNVIIIFFLLGLLLLFKIQINIFYPVLLMALWFGIISWISAGTTSKHYHRLVKALKLNLPYTKKKPEVEIMKE